MSASRPYGLFAGSGDFPAYLMAALKERGARVVVVGFKDDTARELLEKADARLVVEIGEAEAIMKFLREQGVKEAFMAGKVPHGKLLSAGKTDSFAVRFLAKLADRRADTVLKAAAVALRRAGVTLVNPIDYLKPLLPKKGVLTRRSPSEEELKDVEFGAWVARRIAALDVGQTVVVKRRAVLAVEALEGTDDAIVRGGRLGGEGVVVVKVARPKQDFRFDVPVVGPKTIESLRRARAAVLAVEAGRTIILERAAMTAAADESGLCVAAI